MVRHRDAHSRLSCLLLQTENGNARLQRDLEALKKWVTNDWKRVDEKQDSHARIRLGHPASLERPRERSPS